MKRAEKGLDKATEPMWIPIQVYDERSAGIDIRFGSITLEIKPGFDKTLLVELLRAIGAVC